MIPQARPTSMEDGQGSTGLGHALRAATVRAVVRTGALRTIVSAGDSWRIGRLGLLPWPRRRESGRPFQVLCYHRVNDEGSIVFPGVSTKLFEAQMKILVSNWNVLPLQSLVRLARERAIPPRAAAITFDDGYRDNYEHAFPVLRSLGLPATIFLATDPLENGGSLWHDRVFDAFERAAAPIEFEGASLPIASADARRLAVLTVLNQLRLLAPAERDRRIDAIVSQVAAVASPRRRMLNWDEVRIMRDGGIEFGAHTVSHPVLSRISHGEAVAEIRSSKETIEARLGVPVPLFAYPNGRRDDYTPALVEALPELGFTGALTTEWGLNDHRTPPFELHRVGAWDASPAVSFARLGWHRLAG